MLVALAFGLLASSGLVIGAVIGLVTSPPRRVVASVMAFGSGVLVSALTFDLIQDAAERGATTAIVAGFLLGALIYVVLSMALDKMAARSPKREGRQPRDVEPGAASIPESSEKKAIAGMALLLGAVLDGIPENAALGVGLREGGGIGLVLLAAIFLGNLPESISGTVGMREEGRSPLRVLLIWVAATVACAFATLAGYLLLGDLSYAGRSAILALAAGGILAMLADTMMPEAYEHGGPVVAMATAVGFMCAFLLSQAVK